MNQTTRELIEKFSPMWTNKQVWEFDQLNEDLRFDAIYVIPHEYNDDLWKSKSGHPDSEIRDVVVRTFDDMLDGKELWISKNT